jgi:hypothetical protein
MWALIAMEVMHLALHVYLILDILLDGTFPSPYQSKITLSAIFFTFLLFNILSIILIGQLIVFHMKLQQKRLTTYAYIIQEHKDKRELARRLGDLEAKRIALIDQSTGVQKTLLQLGGFCRNLGLSAFDPLDMPPVYTPDPEAGFAAALGPPRNNSSNGNSTELASLAPRETPPPAPLTENEDDGDNGRGGKMFGYDDVDGDDDDGAGGDYNAHNPHGPQQEHSTRMPDNGYPQQHEEYNPPSTTNEPTQPHRLNDDGTIYVADAAGLVPEQQQPSSSTHTRESRQDYWDVVPDEFENEPIDDRSSHSAKRCLTETGVRRLSGTF